MRDGHSECHSRLVLRREPDPFGRRGRTPCPRSRGGGRLDHRRRGLFLASRGRRGSARRGVAASGAGRGGRAAAGSRYGRFGRYVPQRHCRPGHRDLRSADDKRHFGRRAGPCHVRRRRPLRRALCRHAHEGRPADDAVAHRLPPGHRFRGGRLFPPPCRTDARRRYPPRTDRPRSRFRIRQDRGAELPPARRAARALCAGLPGARGAFAQVDDL